MGLFLLIYSEEELVNVLLGVLAKEGGKGSLLFEKVKLMERGPVIDASFRKSLRHKMYDVVIGADGAQSNVRETFYRNVEKIPQNLDYTGIITRMPSTLDFEDRGFEWWGQSSRVSLFPIGKDKVALTMFYSNEMTKEELGDNFPAQYLFTALAAFKGSGIEMIVNDIRYQLTNMSKRGQVPVPGFTQSTYKFTIFGSIPKNIVLIGEAIHQIDPSIFQQTAISIEDAIQVANVIESGETFESFYQKRKDIVELANMRGKSFSNESTKQMGRFRMVVRQIRLKVYKGWYLFHRMMESNKGSFPDKLYTK
jgi:2-polyprenyl-6-methoxyphenol hydroxylase-like FAD-dependent oxidoreductase